MKDTSATCVFIQIANFFIIVYVSLTLSWIAPLQTTDITERKINSRNANKLSKSISHWKILLHSGGLH